MSVRTGGFCREPRLVSPRRRTPCLYRNLLLKAHDMSEVELKKRLAAMKSLEVVGDGMRIGLGTGSTVAHLLSFLAEKLNRGHLRDVMGVPTSLWTADRARNLGIPLTSLSEHPELDVTIDGADEVDPDLNLIKGLGGALLREKMVAQASKRLVIIADDEKVVDRLGTRSPLPVEVVQFGWQIHLAFFKELGGRPVVRTVEGGSPLVTDNGNYIVDVHFDGGMDDPSEVDRCLKDRAGIVETGLFIGMTRAAIIGHPNRVDVMTNSADDK
jgi:ribose 5-phosphate isomerase A